MRAVVQRVASARVHIDGKTVGSIGNGLAILLGIRNGDGPEQVKFMAGKIATLRIFEDQNGKMNLSAADVGGDFLVVSQFTLYGDCSKGRRPAFTEALAPGEAKVLYDMFVEELSKYGRKVATGEFGAHMVVEIHNDGPVTLIVESPAD